MNLEAVKKFNIIDTNIITICYTIILTRLWRGDRWVSIFRGTIWFSSSDKALASQIGQILLETVFLATVENLREIKAFSIQKREVQWYQQDLQQELDNKENCVVPAAHNKTISNTIACNALGETREWFFSGASWLGFRCLKNWRCEVSQFRKIRVLRRNTIQ